MERKIRKNKEEAKIFQQSFQSFQGNKLSDNDIWKNYQKEIRRRKGSRTRQRQYRNMLGIAL